MEISSVEKQSLEKLFAGEILAVDTSLRQYFPEAKAFPSLGMDQLNRSINYSLLSGGKRFRPVLALLVAETLGASPEKVLPVAAAIEFIHTYSLIHDDLPAMDNDDLRRGRPTNHVVFGEATALLAGDALLTEAFGVVAQAYKKNPAVAVALVELLVSAAGFWGMVGGQALDMEPVDSERSAELMRKIHELKTGALIRVSCEAAAVACEARFEERSAMRLFGENLGLAFQLADDLLDFDPKAPEKTSYVNLAGVDETRRFLQSVTELALVSVEGFGERANKLRQLVWFNLERVNL
jgi:geranylgeranyl diphosphate synthase type II